MPSDCAAADRPRRRGSSRPGSTTAAHARAREFLDPSREGEEPVAGRRATGEVEALLARLADRQLHGVDAAHLAEPTPRVASAEARTIALLLPCLTTVQAKGSAAVSAASGARRRPRARWPVPGSPRPRPGAGEAAEGAQPAARRAAKTGSSARADEAQVLLPRQELERPARTRRDHQLEEPLRERRRRVVDLAVEGEMPPKADTGSHAARARAPTAGGAEAEAAGVGVLDHHAAALAVVADQLQRRHQVDQVVVAQFLAPVQRRGRRRQRAAAAAGVDVERGLLVRVLAVAQRQLHRGGRAGVASSSA